MRFICFLAVGFMIVPSAQAFDFHKMYTEAGITANTVDTGKDKYRPLTVSAKLAYVLSPNFSIETNIATNVHKSEKEAQQLKLRNLTGLYLRYGSPLIDKDYTAYLSAGYSYATLDITDARGNYFKDHKGFTFALGLEKKIPSQKIKLVLEYFRFTDDKTKDFVISGFTIGVRTPVFCECTN